MRFNLHQSTIRKIMTERTWIRLLSIAALLAIVLCLFPAVFGQISVSGNLQNTFARFMLSNYGGPQTFSSINAVYYVSQGTGADLGAKMNSQIAACQATYTACKYIIDTSGTISTPPNFPFGSIVECTATAPITLATTWTIQHRNVVLKGNGCQLNFNRDASTAAVVVSKNAFGAVNTSGTTVTYSSGTNFANIDPGDGIYINGVAYNVATVTPPNSLTITASAGTQTGVAYAAGLGEVALANYDLPVRISDLWITYAGAGTTSSTGFNAILVNGLLLDNVQISNFTGNQSQGFRFNGVIGAKVDLLQLVNNKCQMVIDQNTAGGITQPSTYDLFTLPLIQSGGLCTSNIAVSINNGASGIEFSAPLMEGNASKYGIYSQNSSSNIIVRDGFFELEGSGTSGSADLSFNSGVANLAENNEFTSLSTNTPTVGIVCSGSSTFCTLRNNQWGPTNNAYTDSWLFSSGAKGIIAGNSPDGSAHTDPANVQDIAGNYTVNSVIVGGASKINQIYRVSGASLNSAFTSIMAGTCQDQTITVTGAATTGDASVSPTAAVGTGFSWSAWVSAANTVSVHVCSGTTGTPTSVTWNVTVTQ